MDARKTLGRNDPCPCGSGKKYKQCCLDKDEAKAREARAKEAAAAAEKPAAAEAAGAAHAGPPPRQKAQPSQTWKRGVANTRGFQRTTATRKVGGGG